MESQNTHGGPGVQETERGSGAQAPSPIFHGLYDSVVASAVHSFDELHQNDEIHHINKAQLLPQIRKFIAMSTETNTWCKCIY